MHDNYIRPGHVERIIDGDSLVVMGDLGFKVYTKIHIRLAGIDAPERGEAGWSESRGHLAEILQPGQQVIVESLGYQSFARWVCRVRLPSGVDVGEVMVHNGFAEVSGGQHGLGEQ